MSCLQKPAPMFHCCHTDGMLVLEKEKEKKEFSYRITGIIIKEVSCGFVAEALIVPQTPDCAHLCD